MPNTFDTGPAVRTDITGTGNEHNTQHLIYEIIALAGGTGTTGAILDVKTAKLIDLERAFATASVQNSLGLLDIRLRLRRKNVDKDLRSILISNGLLCHYRS